MSSIADVVITGFGLEVPGLSDAEDLLASDVSVVPGVFHPEARLGRAGLRYKDRATKLGLCAAKAAIAHAGLSEQRADEAEATGVIVSSSLGNLDSIVGAIQTLRCGTADDLSPMSLPNLSSNIIASTIAIRFGLRAINLTLCNGASSGTDALYIAANALRAGRARRMLVVGVEPYNEVVDHVMAGSLLLHDHGAPASSPRLGEGAACVVLETASDALRRGATPYGAITEYHFTPPDSDHAIQVRQSSRRRFTGPHLWLTPNVCWPAAKTLYDTWFFGWGPNQPLKLDLSARLGELYSALGVFQAVAACQWLRRNGQRQPLVVLATSGGSWGDGTTSISMTLPTPEGDC